MADYILCYDDTTVANCMPCVTVNDCLDSVHGFRNGSEFGGPAEAEARDARQADWAETFGFQPSLEYPAETRNLNCLPGVALNGTGSGCGCFRFWGWSGTHCTSRGYVADVNVGLRILDMAYIAFLLSRGALIQTRLVKAQQRKLGSTSCRGLRPTPMIVAVGFTTLTLVIMAFWGAAEIAFATKPGGLQSWFWVFVFTICVGAGAASTTMMLITTVLVWIDLIQRTSKLTSKQSQSMQSARRVATGSAVGVGLVCVVLTLTGAVGFVPVVTLPVMLILIVVYPTSSRGLRKILIGMGSVDAKMGSSMREVGFYTVRYADLVTAALVVFLVGTLGFLSPQENKQTPEGSQAVSLGHTIFMWLMEFAILLCSHAVIWYTTRAERRASRRKKTSASIHASESSAGKESAADSNADRAWATRQEAAASTAVGDGASVGESSQQESTVASTAVGSTY